MYNGLPPLRNLCTCIEPNSHGPVSVTNTGDSISIVVDRYAAATATCDGCVLSQCACRGAAAAAWSPTKNYHGGGAILTSLSTPMMTTASSRGMNHSSAREERVEEEKEVEGVWLENHHFPIISTMCICWSMRHARKWQTALAKVCI